jgi:hypothetical protein
MMTAQENVGAEFNLEEIYARFSAEWSFAHLRLAGGGRRAEQGIERVCPWT